MNAFLFGQWSNWILTLNGIKNVMTTKSLRSLQGKITPQWVIKNPWVISESGGYGIIGKILMARLYICVGWDLISNVFHGKSTQRGIILISQKRQVKLRQPKATEQPWGWIQGQVSDISWTRLWILLTFKTPVICSFCSIAHNGDSLQLILVVSMQ